MDTNKLKILKFRTSVCQEELVNRFNKFSREFSKVSTLKTSPMIARSACKRLMDRVNVRGAYKFGKNTDGKKFSIKCNAVDDVNSDDDNENNGNDKFKHETNKKDDVNENDVFDDDVDDPDYDCDTNTDSIISSDISSDSDDASEKSDILKEDSTDDSNEGVYDLYERHFKHTNKHQFQSFDATGDSDMPYFISIFKDFDTVNDQSCTNFDITKLNRDVALYEYYSICNYFEAPEFTIDLLKTTKYDHVVNAIISYILFWSNDCIDEYIKCNPKYTNLLNAIRTIRELDGGQYIFEYKGLPFIKQAFKILRRHFESETTPKAPFDWLGIMDHDFINHLYRVYTLILENKFDFETIKMLEADMEIPYKLPGIDIAKLRAVSNQNQFKFITGQACCCKTTILNKLIEIGWRKFSRGDVGSFSGKSTSSAAIGNLHAALDFILTRPNVIGDRGYIDNVIWSFIMPACNSNESSSFVNKMLSFLNANFNEPSIAQYISQKGLIFIDPYVDLNRSRQLRRCVSGDAHRARIFMYPIAQFMTYYTVARLFGWKVICVPYDVDRNFDNVKYEQNIDLIRNYFGTPTFDDIVDRQVIRFAKPHNNYTIDTLYPKIVGIFK
ncbi:GrBNV gp17-like protein-like protein [Mauternbach virus]|uniref:GrBNV gp17-like protein-like protein n=1 Tax=Mauternbach virus TaxID=2486603 RepID=A0A3G3E861_9VIRU|nr:GrBNV gp17-like protein-like protein [Mauternbach virus]AYP97904.1 GrBNV gp17-like protein-like protein [Mauternbach virus]